MSAAENSSAIDFVPGLAEVKSPAMRKVEDTARDLLAANAELQRQVAAGKRNRAVQRLEIEDLTAERDAARADLATEQADLGEQLAQARADALNAAADRDTFLQQRDFAIRQLDRVCNERDAAKARVVHWSGREKAARSQLDNLRGEIEARERGNRKWREAAYGAQAEVDRLEEALADQHERASAVVAAWTEEGPVARIHRRWKQRVRGGWPALGRALDRLATEVR